MRGLLEQRGFRYLTLAIVAGLLCCTDASADLIHHGGEGSGMDAGLNAIDPFSGMPGAGFTSPDAFGLASYWFSIISDPWNNYSLILELFGPQGAAALLAAVEPSPLLHPQLDPGPGVTDQSPLATGGRQVPEPVTPLLFGAGLLLLGGLVLRARGSQGTSV